MKKKEIYFKNKTNITKLYQDVNTSIWFFEFKKSIFFQTSVFWRLSHKGKIIFTSSDNNKKYIFNKPKIDLALDVLKYINDRKLICIKRIKKSSDLVFVFQDNIKITFYLSSIAFENWNLHIDKKQYICIGGGEIAVFNN